MKWKLIFISMLFLSNNIEAQQPSWKIVSPQKDSIVSNQNLFIVATLSNFSLDNNVLITLDDKILNGNMKISGSNISLLNAGTLSDGKHQITIKTFIKALNQQNEISWYFYVNVKKDNISKKAGLRPTVEKPVQGWQLQGSLVADSRNEILSGLYADSLRQEPVSTRTVSLDMKIKHNSLEIPIKLYATTDNATSGYLPRNFFQIGLHYKNIEADYGDLNPSLNQLIVTGIRVNGFHLKLKLGNTSIQTYYGNMVQNAVEGTVNVYTPGSGYIPSTLYFDTKDSSLKYVVPGVYKRWMAAGRFEYKKSSNDNFKIGVTGFKATDIVKSIQYGFQPKDNVVGGLDMSMKLFRKTIQLSSEIAGSALTNDISFGVMNTALLDSAFNTQITFNAASYYPYLTINSSTVPGRLVNASDALAYTVKMVHTLGNSSFNIEYRNYGPSFYSLGNPYLKNNYKGISVGEHYSFWKRKITVSANYQSYINNLNNTQPLLVTTHSFNGSLFVNISPKLPNLFFNYLQQQRDGLSNLESSVPSVNDFVNFYLANLSYRFKMFHLEHGVRASFTINERKDIINPQTRSLMYNYMTGYNATLKKVTVSVDGGQTIIEDYQNNKIANIFTYSVILEWKIIPNRFFTSAGIANNRTMMSMLSPASLRMGYIYKAGYRLKNGMGLDLEGGYTPYKDYGNSLNNYDEKYIYVRYTYNFNLHL